MQTTIRTRGIDALISDIEQRQVVGDEQTWLLAETLRLVRSLRQPRDICLHGVTPERPLP